MDADEPLLGLGGAQTFKRHTAHEVDRLPSRDRKPEAGRDRVVARTEVVTPRPKAALQSRGVEGDGTGVA
jgi:hypothetical protein